MKAHRALPVHPFGAAAGGLVLLAFLLDPARAAPPRPARGGLALAAPRLSLDFDAKGSGESDAASPPAPATISARPMPRRPVRVSPSAAFRAELRDEAIEYRFGNRWAYADETLQGDRPVRRGRSRAAENMLGDAVGAAMEVVLRGALDRPKRRSPAGTDERVHHELRMDSRPAWRLRKRTGMTHLRLDLPLSAHEDLRLRCTRRFDGDRFERELGTSLRFDPWDQSISLGFELDF